MGPGSTVAGRFRIEARVGAGAMGEVFRAADLELGRTVALKLLRPSVPEGRSRFEREMTALERLSHPGVVAHVAHGSDELPYLAMEWLEGEDLRVRLEREPLSVQETLLLGRELADALAHVHERGTVHRDVKPGNVFLERGAVERPKLVDFGLARILGVPDVEDAFHSASGVLVGTPGYMAPEQARGQAGVEADVFSLGCLLYKCLTGHAPFQAPDMVGTLARVLFDEAAPLSDHTSGIPTALDALVLRMLVKDPALRPSARAVEASLREMDGSVPASERRKTTPRGLTARERRMVSVVLAYRGVAADAEETLRGTKNSPALAILDGVRVLSERFGATVEFIGASILAVFSARGGANDPSARAARLGLELAKLFPDAPVAVAPGRAEVMARVVGDVVDSAITIARSGIPGRLVSDAITIGLLGAHFSISDSESRLVIARELPRGEVTPRTLLGKPTPCVGRDRELADLDALLGDCVTTQKAEIALFIAASGAGKSRLRYEWLRRLRAREDAPRIVTARCDAMTGSAPLALASQWIREAAAVSPAESAERARARIAARVSAIAPASEAARLTDFLAEIAGANGESEGAASVQLVDAHEDAMLMGDQIRAAFTDWLRYETESTPLVCVVDDLQWGDAASIGLVDAALDALRDAPIFVLALARPELRTTFTTLWEGRSVTERRLPDLGGSAATALARAVLGSDAPSDVIAALVRRAAGNAFFLEEMLRAHAEGERGDAPQTVQAIVQRRLEAFSDEARRTLRAAAVFGMSFWTGAVAALVDHSTKLGQTLRELRDREVLSLRTASRFEGQEEWVFRHAYVRDAAYATLTSDDRALGHRLAGEWLEMHRERDALLLVDHFERGGEPARTIPHLRRAAHQALDGNDLDLVIRIAERGRESGATGEALGELCRYAAEALRWRARLEGAEEYAALAIASLAPSTPTWYAAVAELATAATVQGHIDHLLAARALLADDMAPEMFVTARVVALARVAGQLVVAGRPIEAEQLLCLAEASDISGSARARARLAQARGFRALHASDPSSYRRWAAEARDLFTEIGDRRNACVQSVNLGCAVQALGRSEEALAIFVPARASGVALGLTRIVALIDQNLALARLARGEVEASIEIQRGAAEFFASQCDRRLECFSRIYLAWALEAGSRIDEAFTEAWRAVETSAPLPPALAAARATLADLELRLGDAARGTDLILSAYATLQLLGGLEECEARVRLVYIDAMLLRDDHAAAKAETERVLRGLEERIKGIDDPTWRTSFVGLIAEHRRIVARANQQRIALPEALARSMPSAPNAEAGARHAKPTSAGVDL
ncbi:hypothetical protein BH09MYX1_BH09MYX1_14840 [soil metagenome]